MINFVLFYWLKSSHRLLPDSRGEDMPGCEHEEMGIMDITWSLSATVHFLPPMIHILSRCEYIYSPLQVFRIFTPFSTNSKSKISSSTSGLNVEEACGK